MELSKKQTKLIKNVNNAIINADKELFDLMVKLMLSETPEVDKYFQKQQDIYFTLISEDFLKCSEPMVKKLYHLINHLESIKNFMNINYRNLQSED